MSLPISGDRSTPEHVRKGDQLPTYTEFASHEKEDTEFGREKPGYRFKTEVQYIIISYFIKYYQILYLLRRFILYRI